MASYGSAEQARARTPSVRVLSESTTPTLAQVNAWLAEGYSIINRYLAAAGYSTPVGASAAVRGELASLNNLYVSAHILGAIGIDLSSGDEEDRSEVWMARFYAQLKELVASDLTGVGVSQTTQTTTRRRRIRTLQMKRIDGYSGVHEGATAEPAYPSE